MVCAFQKVLFLEHGEEEVAALVPGRRGQQGRQAVMAGIRLSGGLIDVVDELMRRPPATAYRGRQGRLLLRRQRLELPLNVPGRRFFSQQAGHTPREVLKLGTWMPSTHGGSDLVQTGAETLKVA